MRKNPISSLLTLFLLLGACLVPSFLHSTNFTDKEFDSVYASAPLGYNIHIDGNW